MKTNLATVETGTSPGEKSFTGLIIREREPENLEFPFSALNSAWTPNEQFFVRSHFAVPNLDRKSWRLRIEGAVQRPFELTYDELAGMQARTVATVLECAGN